MTTRDPLEALQAYVAGEPTDPFWCVNCQRHRTREKDELCPVCQGIADGEKTQARTDMGWTS